MDTTGLPSGSYDLRVFGTTPTSPLDPFAQPTPVVEQLFADVLRIR
ncbi:MAG: hypothetical protein IIC87_05005 [Chloroflexi bacterium]|nr:hypothetical protein [Chloroflexota bacterium]